MNGKQLGKLRPTYDKRDLQFASYRKPKIALTRPPSFGHADLVGDWGVLGNDQYGDCVFAGAAHETMLWCAEAKRVAEFDDAAVLSAYSDVTGFSPDNPGSDNGAIVRQALNYRRKIGMPDTYGKRHKLGAYVALEPGHWERLLDALYLFGAVGIGFEFPSSAWDQFDTGRPWSVVWGARIEGGHYVPLVAYRDRLVCITWGKMQQMTRAFYEKYCDEAWALASNEMLLHGKSIDGFSFEALQADLRDLRLHP